MGSFDDESNTVNMPARITTCAVLGEKSAFCMLYYILLKDGGYSSGWERCFRACDDVGVCRAADGKPATSRTGSTVMRCLGGRNIDPVGPRRTLCATLQRLTTKNPSSKKKIYIYTSIIYPTEQPCDHCARGWLHIKEEPYERRRILGFISLSTVSRNPNITYFAKLQDPWTSIL